MTLDLVFRRFSSNNIMKNTASDIETSFECFRTIRNTFAFIDFCIPG